MCFATPPPPVAETARVWSAVFTQRRFQWGLRTDMISTGLQRWANSPEQHGNATVCGKG